MTVYVVPADTWKVDDASLTMTEGDLLLRNDGDVVVLGRVTGAGAEWLGPVPEGSVEVEQVDEISEADGVTDEDLQPLLLALAERGA